MSDFIPRRARHHSRMEHFQFFVLGLATIYEGLVLVLSLGFATVEARAWVLFEAWEDD